MGPGEHRPHDHEYWTQPWSTTLFAGDLFEAIPFGDQPTVIYAGDQEPVAGKHFVGEVVFGYGLLVTPIVSDGLLANPPRRLAQLQPPARRHLKVKLAAYWARVTIDPAELPLQERDEEAVRASRSPASPYDH